VDPRDDAAGMTAIAQQVPTQVLFPTREVEPFHRHGGSLRMSEALRLCISRKSLYAMRDAGVPDLVTRGFYRLAALEPRHTPTSSPAFRACHEVSCASSRRSCSTS
jgi:hypothetical protein